MNQTKRFSKNAQKDFSLIDDILLYKSEHAYSELMERYKKSVYHMILKKVFNQEDAEDLTIETFSKAFHKLALFKKNHAFTTWLFRIATNHTIDFMRRKKIRTTSIHRPFSDEQGADHKLYLLDQNLVPDEMIIKDQKVELVRLFVNQMESKYQQLITLRYFDELSYSEIAELLDTPLGTIKAQLYRSRILLSNLLNNKGQHI